MEIDDSFAGTSLKPFVRRIKWRETTNYAAAVDDNNACYFDDERPDGLVAHPVFCAAVTWPVVEKIWDFIEADHFPLEILATQVHYSEHLRFFRLVRPDDRLHVKGKIAAILPHRAGTRVVLRFDVTDGAGEPVFTECIGSLMRGVKCKGPGKEEGSSAMSFPMEGPFAASINERCAQPVWISQISIDPLRPYIYDGCSNIVFPIHTSKKFARQAGLPGTLLQGTATLAFAVRELINREAGGNPNRICSLDARFSGMVMPGTEIKIVLLSRKILSEQIYLAFCVINGDGARVIKDGLAVFSTDVGS